jgi:sugar/nucleoside kinase (ribokinase family)
VVADTMNYWISSRREPLGRVLARVDGLVVNDAEARALSGKSNLIAAGRALLALGPRFVVVKKGEHGSFLFSEQRSFALPSYPLETLVDPTGAGDSFAGGILGRLAETGGRRVEDVCEAMVHGTVVASFTVSAFSLDALASLTRARLDARADELRRFISP